MKNKRNVLIAFVLICSLCLSIGYAALTDTLIINGNVSVDADGKTDDPADSPVEKSFDEDLGWTKVVLTSSTSASNNATWTITSGTGDSAANITNTGVSYDYLDEVTFNVSGFAEAGDNVVLTYTIGNKHPDLSASVAPPTITGATDYFEVTTDWGTTAKVVAANNGTQTVQVTVKMIKTPVEDKTATFTLTFNATAQEATSNSGT